MQLRQYLQKTPKKFLIFDFDETIARMEIDWNGWQTGMAELYQSFDPQLDHKPHGEHLRYNTLARRFGPKLIQEAKNFNEKYETEHATGFTPYPELIEFIKEAHQDKSYEMFIYSSNSRQTVEKALKELEISGIFR